MALLPDSLFIYGVASGAFSALVLIFAGLAFLARSRGRHVEQSGADGHLAWAEEEFEQIAAQRSPPRQAEPELDESLFRAEMMMEARRLIAEATAEKRDGAKVSVEEALAHGLDVTNSSGLRRRLSSHLEQLEARSPRFDKVSRIKQLRLLVEADEPHSAFAGTPQLEWQGRR